jgi:4-azaleucine resistance transporter AzlC
MDEMTQQIEAAAPTAAPCRTRLMISGTIAMLPLSIAVLPWGLLAGSFAVDSGLSPFESQALSAILFAGAAQLAATGMFKAGAGLLTMLVTTLFITSRHLLYSVSLRSKVAPLPTHWRVILGFLLTDELFALIGHQDERQFNRWYAFGAGFSFYLIWNLATLAGILLGSTVPWLKEIGLEFAIAATFIAIIIPTIKSLPVLISVVTGLVLSVVLTMYQIESYLIIASICAMLAGYIAETVLPGKAEHKQ